jgi:hypothetical protein
MVLFTDEYKDSLVKDYIYMDVYNNYVHNFDAEFRQWEILEKENKMYLEYNNNTERAIVPYVDYVGFYNILVVYLNIIYSCLVYFVIIPGKFVDI